MSSQSPLLNGSPKEKYRKTAEITVWAQRKATIIATQATHLTFHLSSKNLTLASTEKNVKKIQTTCEIQTNPVFSSSVLQNSIYISRIFVSGRFWKNH